MHWNISSSLKRALFVYLFWIPAFSHAQSPRRAAIVAVTEEAPAGLIDGNNVTFSLSANPSPDQQLKCFINGLPQHQDEDFHVTGQVLTFIRAKVPRPGDIVTVFYRPSNNAHGDQRSAALAKTPLVQTDSVAKTLHDQVALLLITAPPSAMAGDPKAKIIKVGEASGAGGDPPSASRALSLLKRRMTQARGGATKSGATVSNRPSESDDPPYKKDVTDSRKLEHSSQPGSAASTISGAEPASVRDLKARLRERAENVAQPDK